MKLKVFTVFDAKIGAYAKPFFMNTKGEAFRAWIDTVNDPNTSINKHPEDYQLYEMGDYDDATGKFENYPSPVSLGYASEVHKGYARTAQPS